MNKIKWLGSMGVSLWLGVAMGCGSLLLNPIADPTPTPRPTPTRTPVPTPTPDPTFDSDAFIQSIFDMIDNEEYQLSMVAMVEQRLLSELRGYRVECNSDISQDIEIVYCTARDGYHAMVLIGQYDLFTIPGDYVTQRYIGLNYMGIDSAGLNGIAIACFGVWDEEEECATEYMSIRDFAELVDEVHNEWLDEISEWAPY